MAKTKPQVILRITQDDKITMIKKWGDGALSIETHAAEAALCHNTNVPLSFSPIDMCDAKRFFTQNGKEYIPCSETVKFYASRF